MTGTDGGTIGFRTGRGLRYAAAVAALIMCGASPAGAQAEPDAFDVKSAFREATRHAARSTVTILCDGRNVAMGTVIASDGYVLTKASELTGGIACQFHGLAARLSAEVVGVVEEHDLALLKVRAENLPVIRWTGSNPPPVGSWLATPGMDATPLAIGVVSVAAREIASRVPALGIVIEDASAKQGARVHRIVPGSGAERAGIKPGDVITHLEGRPVATRDELIAATRQHSPGDRVQVQARRGAEIVNVVATLNDLAELSTVHPDVLPELLSGRLSKRRAGFPVAIQHDTVLQPQQCGGPLVNLDGEAVGINIARASRVASYAIPAQVVQSAISRLVAERLVATTPTD